MSQAAFLDLLGSRDLPPDILSRIQRAAPNAATSHEQQVQAAALYVKALVDGATAPVQKVADRMFLSRGRIRDLLHEARRNGYLTKARHGRAEGHLTPKGIAALETLNNQEAAR
jgi:hypothetical protein